MPMVNRINSSDWQPNLLRKSRTSCRLLFQRLPQLAEQPRILDSDDGLRGEIGYKFDLVACEWLHL